MKGELGLFYRIDLIRPDGTTVRGRTRRCESFVTGFIDYMHYFFTGGVGNIADTASVSQAPIGTATSAMSVLAGAANDTFGPVFGTSAVAPAVTDVALTTKILEGATAGKLNYGATTVSASSTAAPSRQFTVTRPATNNSGGIITVNEVGLYGQNNGSLNFCLARDAVAGVAVAAGAGIVCVYTIKITV